MTLYEHEKTPTFTLAFIQIYLTFADPSCNACLGGSPPPSSNNMAYLNIGISIQLMALALA
jgi:hypothetical protein